MTFTPTAKDKAELPAALLAALAAPHTHEVVTTYADGTTRRFTTRNEASAENYAKRDRANIGRQLIVRETRAKVTIVSVDVRPIA